jgi:antitoxin (DNA-binding transcriptional repressor) of toxin-antitoxin stability system
MKTIDLDNAHMQLSDLLAEIALGDDLLIFKDGRPIAQLYPIPQATLPRTPGAMAGRISIADDFDAPLPDDLQAAFDGK